MISILAAIDNDGVAHTPVLEATRVMADLLDANAAAIHVGSGDVSAVRASAEAAEVPLDVRSGDAAAVLIAALEQDGVVLGVFGARNRPNGPRPTGHIVHDVVTATTKPVLVVPPAMHVSVPGEALRILLPLDGDPHTDEAAQQHIQALFNTIPTDVLVLHALVASSVPRCWDHTHHAYPAWSHEFMARHWTEAKSPLRLSRDTPARAMLGLTGTQHFDVVALTWGQTFAHGRAPVVRQMLSESTVPILLLPRSTVHNPSEALLHEASRPREKGRATAPAQR